MRFALFYSALNSFSLNSTDLSSFERQESRVSFERQLSGFPCVIFCRVHLSQKPSFSRGLVQ